MWPGKCSPSGPCPISQLLHLNGFEYVHSWPPYSNGLFPLQVYAMRPGCFLLLVPPLIPCFLQISQSHHLPKTAVYSRSYKGLREVTTIFTFTIRTCKQSCLFECFAGSPFSGLMLWYLDISPSIFLFLNLSVFPLFSSLPLRPSLLDCL